MKGSTALLFVLGPAAGCGKPERPPNVALVVIDTLRADHVGAYGYPRPTSPHLDRLARQGVLLERALAAAPWSAPSHSSMVTGVYPGRHGALDWRTRIRPDVPLLAERLAALGYDTFQATSHVALATMVGGIDRGIAERKMVGIAKDDLVTSELRAFLRRERQAPFFAWAIMVGPHAPYEAPAPYGELFVEPPPPGEPQVPHVGDTWWSDQGIPRSIAVPDQSGRAYYVDAYDEEIAAVDAHLGVMGAELHASGSLEETFLVVCADHGEGIGEHDFWGHGAKSYEELLHVPMVARLPAGGEGGRIVPGLVSLVDLVPTVLELAGAPAADGLDGVSQLALLGWGDGEASGARRVVFASHAGHQAMASSRTEKVVLDPREGLASVDLVADPAEAHPVPGRGHGDLAPRLEDYAKRQSAPVRDPSVGSAEGEQALRTLGYVD